MQQTAPAGWGEDGNVTGSVVGVCVLKTDVLSLDEKIIASW